MAGSDVRAIRLTATGSAGVGPARIRQVQVKTTSGSPRITFTNGNGGATVLDMDLDASDTHSVNIPLHTPALHTCPPHTPARSSTPLDPTPSRRAGSSSIDSQSRRA